MAAPARRNISKKQKMDEILKCGQDPKYFIANYLRISHPLRGFVPFKLYPFQEECLDQFQEHKFIIVNKSRQLGLSTSAAAYSLWMALFQREKNILVIATKLDVAKNFIKKVKANLKSCPEWLVMPKIVGDSVRHLEFSNGSKITAIPTSADAGRSEALSLLIVDEAAHVEGIDELWLGLKPTLSTGGSAILISSPSGVGTLFHRIWTGAHDDQNNRGEGKNEFFPIELPWTVHPEHDQKWFEEQKAGLIEAVGERGVAQELLCSFHASGDTFVKTDVMDNLFKNIKDPIEKIGVGVSGRDEAWIWKHPESDHRYVIGADVARGDGADYSAFNIIDIETDEVVCDFKGKCQPDKFAEYLIQFAEQFNNATICQELNNVGVVAAIKLKESGYTNLYYEKHQKNMYMSYMSEDIGDELPGFTTTQNSRIEILSKLSNGVRNRKLKLYSKRLYEELQTFIWKGDKPQAQKGYNDDLVMALAIASNLYESTSKNMYSSTEDAMAMLAGISHTEHAMDSNTGKLSTRDEQRRSDITGDGFFANPNKKDNNFLRSTEHSKKVESNKHMSLRPKNTHNYKDQAWDTFRWVFDD